MKHRILIVDDEEGMCLSLSEILEDAGFTASFTVDPREVKDLLKKYQVGLMIMDVKMPYLGGMDLLKIVKHENSDIPIIMITGYPSVDNAVQAMRCGALNFYTKPLNIPKLLQEITQIFASREKQFRKHLEEKIVIHTCNPRMEKLIENIKKVASTDVPVLITGESGTGKEHAANLLHMYSPRGTDKLVKVNCAAIPDNLLESELFGYEKGAFTGAVSSRVGKFELADGGTIFLDEIGDMSISTQAKMLRVLEEKQFERLGGNKVFTTDVRLLSATNRSLDELIEEGNFREDLFYRLSVVTLELIPLRERKEDVSLLTDFFLSYFNEMYEKHIHSVSPGVRDIFINHKWPGNIRELKNCIQRAVIFCEGDTIQCTDLSSQYCRTSSDCASEQGIKSFEDNLCRERIKNALDKTGGNKQQAADLLKIHRKTLYNKMKRLGMQM